MLFTVSGVRLILLVPLPQGYWDMACEFVGGRAVASAASFGGGSDLVCDSGNRRGLRRLAAVVALGAVLVAGCGSASTTKAQTPRPDATTSTTGGNDTRPDPSTSSTSIDPSPSTSIAAVPRTAMLKAFATGNRAYQQCVIDPAKCSDRSLASTYDGDALTNLRKFIARLRKENLRVRYPTADSYYGVVSESSVTATGTTGSVTVCGVDGGVLYDQRDPARTDDDVIVNDQLNSSNDVWSMQLVDGRWKRTGFDNITTWTGVNRCPPRNG